MQLWTSRGQHLSITREQKVHKKLTLGDDIRTVGYNSCQDLHNWFAAVFIQSHVIVVVLEVARVYLCLSYDRFVLQICLVHFFQPVI